MESGLAPGVLPEEEMDNARPENTLGEGSLGPRKRLEVLRKRYRQPSSNGNGRHR
jgi:hypothetical protein